MAQVLGADPQIQVVILTFQRSHLLKKCLESVFAAMEHSSAALRVDVLVNGPCLETQNLLSGYSQRSNLFVHSLSSGLLPGAARNQIRGRIAAPWLCFLDDDVEIPQNFFEDFLKLSKDSDCGVWGGPNLTPENSNFFQILSGFWLSSLWGAGGSAQRYRSVNLSEGRISALTLCNLFVQSELFLKAPFPENFSCAEEIMMLENLKKMKVKFGHSEKLRAWHFRRDSAAGFFSQVHKYAIGRGQCLRSGIGSFYHWIPSLFIAGLFARIAGFSALDPLLSLYLTLNLVSSIFVGYQMKSIKGALASLIGFPLIHLSFGAGVLRGLRISN